MGRLTKLGMMAAAAIALCGPVLLTWDKLFHPHGYEERIWSLFHCLGLNLPGPEYWWLVGPALAIANIPVWLALLVLGALLFGAIWSTTVVIRGHPDEP